MARSKEIPNSGILLATSSSLPGKVVIGYKGIVFGEAIVGVNFVKDAFSKLTDVLGGRSSAYENELRNGRYTAISEMVNDARKVGANAIFGIDIDYEVLGEKSSMLMVMASGTACFVVDDNKNRGGENEE